MGVVELVDPILDVGGRVFRIKCLMVDPGNVLSVGTRISLRIEPQ